MIFAFDAHSTVLTPSNGRSGLVSNIPGEPAIGVEHGLNLLGECADIICRMLLSHFHGPKYHICP